MKFLVGAISLAYLVASATSAAAVGGSPSSKTGASDELPEPQRLHVASGLSKAEADALLKPAQLYYAFWNTGDPVYAKAALADDFIDMNLPEGRPQGPTGPVEASKNFRKAVPDLSVKVKDVYVLKDTVISQLEFSGRFSGEFGKIKGDGRLISFDAVDIYTIKDGRIQKNWHLEDNFKLLSALGAIGPSPSE